MIPNVKYGCWVIMVSMYQIYHLVQRFMMGEAVYMGIGDTWEIFIPSYQFCCESKIDLKHKSY
jgi:hypothetical protein